jgi:trigger factor
MFGWLKKDKENESKGEAAGGNAAVAEKEAPELKVKVMEKKACSATLSVTVPADEVSAAVEEAFKDVQKQAKMPGFRAGKVPLEIVKKNFSGHAFEHGINNLLRETVHLALEQEKVIPLTTPQVDKIEVSEGKPLKYEVKVECPPEVALRDYKGLPVTKKPNPVTDADVTKRLDELREQNARLAPSKDEAVGEKHFVTVDYDAALDGKAVEGGVARDQVVEMSAPQALTGFNDALKGMKVGETKESAIPFPAEHPNKDLAGKPVTFKITVKDIKEKALPAADDEFAKDLGLESLAQLQERLRKSLESDRSREERQEIEKQLIDGLLDRHPFEVPPSLVENRAKELTARLREFIVRQGASDKDWKANEPKMLERNRPEAEKQVRLSYLLVEIAKAEKIEGTEADVDEAIAKAEKETAPEKMAEMKKWFEERRDSLRAQLKEEKIFKFLLDNAKVTEQTAS